MRAVIFTNDKRLVSDITDIFKICLPCLKPEVCQITENVPSLIRAKKPVITIIDCVSANTSIAELTKSIRRVSDSPIVAVCCCDNPKCGISAVESRADLCLFKPLIQLEFAAHIMKLLDTNR